MWSAATEQLDPCVRLTAAGENSLSVWSAATEQLDPLVVEDWVRRQPGGSYARRAWHLYEKLRGREPDRPGTEWGVQRRAASACS